MYRESLNFSSPGHHDVPITGQHRNGVRDGPIAGGGQNHAIGTENRDQRPTRIVFRQCDVLRPAADIVIPSHQDVTPGPCDRVPFPGQDEALRRAIDVVGVANLAGSR